MLSGNQRVSFKEETFLLLSIVMRYLDFINGCANDVIAVEAFIAIDSIYSIYVEKNNDAMKS